MALLEVRERLAEALRGQFKKEIVRSGERIRESMAPYTRFIRAEGEKLESAERELMTALADIASLRSRIETAK